MTTRPYSAFMNTNTTSFTIGLDISDRKVAVCAIDAKGNIVEERSMPNEASHYKLLAKAYPKSTAVLETGSHSPWVSRLTEAEGLKPITALTSLAIYHDQRIELRVGRRYNSSARLILALNLPL